jgi:pimeloyl-ACP methyl ester carboxylesterase
MISLEFFNNLSSASTKDISIGHFAGGMSTARRALSPRRSSKTVNLRLTSCGDDLVDWVEAPPAIPGMSKRRRGVGSSADTANMISFERIPPSDIVTLLVNQDAKLTPQQGLFQVVTQGNNGFEFKACPEFPSTGKVLLFIHGTFSKGENTLEALESTTAGKQFLGEAIKAYGKNVLFFNHPTISVSPMLNAWDLQQIVGGSNASIDIVAHSRGGLVTRWWCEQFDPQAVRCKNAILVGSPLAGTGLAAPPNIRKTLRLLTSYGNAISGATKLATAAVPVMGLVSTLLSVLTSVTSFAAKTPLADGLLAMIPGLHAQSRIGNNQELLGLHRFNANPARYAAIQSNFESEDVGWRFWKYFNGETLKDKAKDLATNTLFDGNNDLVVDTDSMTVLTNTLRIDPQRIYDFGTTSTVHHTNYFLQPKTVDHIRKILKF